MAQTPPILGQTSLIPINKHVLVRLDPTDKHESKYDTRTSGFCLTHYVDPETNKDLFDKHVFFEEYKEGTRIKRERDLYCFIKSEDLTGFEE